MDEAAQGATAVVPRRIGAALVDLILYVVACSALFIALGPERVTTADGLCKRSDSIDPSAAACFSWNGTTYTLSDGRAVALFVLIGVIWLAYHGIYQAFAGSVGKRLFGIDVVTVDGSRARTGRTLARSVTLAAAASFLALTFLLAAAVGLVMVLVHPRHRRVGDLIAGTYVVGRDAVGRPIDRSTRH